MHEQQIEQKKWINCKMFVSGINDRKLKRLSLNLWLHSTALCDLERVHLLALQKFASKAVVILFLTESTE